jgi:hypothetical protein
LFVAGIAAHDEDHAPAANNLATFTDALDAGADLHGSGSPAAPPEYDGLVESESV